MKYEKCFYVHLFTEGEEDDNEKDDKEDEDLEKQMGDVDGPDSDKLDDQMWGSDGEEESEDMVMLLWCYFAYANPSVISAFIAIV